MAFSRQQEKKILAGLLAAFAAIAAYRVLTYEQPRTAPLTYTRGAIASSPVRPGLSSRAAGADLLGVFLAQRGEKFPGVARDIFRMENPASKPRTKPKPTLLSVVTPTVPPTPIKTPEEIAQDLARADLSKFRFLGYLTDRDNTLFLSRDGENFVVRNGDKVLKTYQVKEAGKDHVVLFDTVTRVEVRVELSGGAEQASQQKPR
jgi:hypothetical protein